MPATTRSRARTRAHAGERAQRRVPKRAAENVHGNDIVASKCTHVEQAGERGGRSDSLAATSRHASIEVLGRQTRERDVHPCKEPSPAAPSNKKDAPLQLTPERGQSARTPVVRTETPVKFSRSAAKATALACAEGTHTRRCEDSALTGPVTTDSIESALRQFDLDIRFGPCVGIKRMQRWERAQALGLQPSRRVRELLSRAAASAAPFDPLEPIFCFPQRNL
jgi:hypothetical protein